MIKKLAAVILVLFCALALASCDGGPGENVTEVGSVYTSEEYGAVLITGLDKDSLAQNDELEAWLELCAEEGRDDIGTYAFKYTEQREDQTLYRFLLYRTRLDQGADRALSFSDGGFFTAKLEFTSNRKETAGYDMTYIEFQAPTDKKVVLDALCDGENLGLVVTNTELDFSKIVNEQNK